MGETQTVSLGSDIDNQNSYQGAIRELAIWNKVRSAEEIKAGMKSCLQGNEEGLVGYWSLNEASGNTVYDKTANQNHGAIKGATWQEVEVPTVRAVAEASKMAKRRVDIHRTPLPYSTGKMTRKNHKESGERHHLLFLPVN